MKAKFLFLGSGASLGVPVIGCNCSVCRSNSKKNKRLRPSGLLTINNKNFLIDAGPDFRMQSLIYKIKKPDAIFFTHLHYDHVGGLDDARIFYYTKKKTIPCFLSKETFLGLEKRYEYFFNKKMYFDFYVLKNDFGSFEIENVKVKYFSFLQGDAKVTGFRIGDFAYVSDIREFSKKLLIALKGTKIIVVSGLRKKSSNAHFSIYEAIAFGRLIKAEKIIINHISHDVDHDEISKNLPKDVVLSFDGMEVDFLF